MGAASKACENRWCAICHAWFDTNRGLEKVDSADSRSNIQQQQQYLSQQQEQQDVLLLLLLIC